MEANMYYQYDSRQLPMIRLLDTAMIEPPYVHKKRRPGEYILYLIRSGEMYLSEDRTLYHLLPGDFLLLDPDRTHVGRKATKCEYYYVHFQYESLKPIGISDGELEQLCLKDQDRRIMNPAARDRGSSRELLILPKQIHLAADAGYHRITQQLNEGIRFQNNPMNGYAALAACRVLEVLIAVSGQFLSQSFPGEGHTGGRSRKIQELLDYLNMYYYDPICGDSLEERFDCNFDYMNRLFRQQVGKTIFQYLGEVRIAHARELLAASSMRVSQISEKVGFADESYFSKVFKRHTGVSPSNFMKNGTGI